LAWEFSKYCVANGGTLQSGCLQIKEGVAIVSIAMISVVANMLDGDEVGADRMLPLVAPVHTPTDTASIVWIYASIERSCGGNTGTGASGNIPGLKLGVEWIGGEKLSGDKGGDAWLGFKPSRLRVRVIDGRGKFGKGCCNSDSLSRVVNPPKDRSGGRRICRPWSGRCCSGGNSPIRGLAKLVLKELAGGDVDTGDIEWAMWDEVLPSPSTLPALPVPVTNLVEVGSVIDNMLTPHGDCDTDPFFTRLVTATPTLSSSLSVVASLIEDVDIGARSSDASPTA
jgi:hypothetical protein